MEELYFHNKLGYCPSYRKRFSAAAPATASDTPATASGCPHRCRKRVVAVAQRVFIPEIVLLK